MGSPRSLVAFVDSRLLALDLDIDVIRALLGNWLDEPSDAGIAARSLALAMANAHLPAGHDVIVPQFLGRVEFIEQLAAVALDTGAEFVEVALTMDRADTVSAFAERRSSPTTQSHRDAAALVDRSDTDDVVGEMYDSFVRLIDRRPATRRVAAVRGDIEKTWTQFQLALVVET